MHEDLCLIDAGGMLLQCSSLLCRQFECVTRDVCVDLRFLYSKQALLYVYVIAAF